MQQPTDTEQTITGLAAGVPFLAIPPIRAPRGEAPVVVGWHLMEPPRTEAAFAAQVPLRDLDAWRIYLGLPLSGSRLPAGGFDEVMRLGYEDAVLNLHSPGIEGAAKEFGTAFPDLRRQLGFGDGPLGVLGGSAGAGVAQLVAAESGMAIRAVVLISPLVQLRGAIAAGERVFGTKYRWSEASNAVADRLDFVARADELAGDGGRAILLVVGEDDDPEFLESATALRDALRQRGVPADRAKLVTLPGMGHTLVDEPGTEPAPQTAHAAEVDRQAVEWFQRHLRAGR